MRENLSVQVVLPTPSDDTVSHDLRTLTRILHERELADGERGGIFGGEYGYGANFENDTFLLHRYCWCEQEDCRWCSEEACGCPFPPCEYFLDGQSIADWSSANDAILADLKGYPLSKKKTKKMARLWGQRIAERDRRLITVYAARVHTCKPAGLMADRARGDTWMPRQSAPNFWHKPSGSRIWWYKYIGRGMEVHVRGDWRAIISECHTSINTGS